MRNVVGMKASHAAELTAILDRAESLHIGVCGDVALDCYWMLATEAAQPSVETGLSTWPVAEQRYAAGAAGNVAINLAALGVGRVSVFGVTGDDPWGHALHRLLQAAGIDTSGLLVQAHDWETVAYAKPHIGNIEQHRIDFGDFNRLHDHTADHLNATLSSALPDLDALIINVQARAGIHCGRLRDGLASLVADQSDTIVTVDSRDPAAMYPGGMLKINDIEASRVCGLPAPDGTAASRERTRHAARQLFETRAQAVFVTCGAEGMMVCDADGLSEIPAVKLEGEIDTTGAGDAALSGITLALAAGATPATAGLTGNLAAAVCARKLRQTGTASREEILALWGLTSNFMV